MPDNEPNLFQHRDGATYQAERDFARLGRQHQRVYAAMMYGAWRTLAELAELTGEPEASISARLRDFRKPRFGGYKIERRRRGEGQFEYRMGL